MRIVSLACSNTEIVAALGCSHLLVGVDSHSDFPPEVVDRLPRMGPDLEIDVARVTALEPDLVLASLTVPGHETVVEGVEAAGLPVLTLDPMSLDDVYANIREVARRLGVEARGEMLVGEMQETLRRSASIAPKSALPRILIQWWPKPVIAPGARSWAHEVIEAAGGVNPLGHEDRPSRPLTDEEVAELAPDAVVIAWCGVHPDKYRPDVVLRNPAFQDVPAIANRQVHCVPEAFLGRPGPRLVEGVAALRKIVDRLSAPAAVP